MSKLSILTVAATISAIANFDIVNYVKNDLIRNPKVKVNSVKLIEKKSLKKYGDWNAYLILMNLNIGGKDSNYPETILVNEKDGLIAIGSKSLYDYKKHKFIAQNLRPKMDVTKFYNDDHLIAGSKDAKHKLIVFSDPMCPFCRQHVPTIYKDVKAHPKELALYYYHLPLERIHPISPILTRVMEVLKKQGKMDDAMKLYTLPESFIRETNEDKVLAELKKRYNIDVTKEQIDKDEIKNAVKADVLKANEMFVRGTPTVYLDGKFDNNVTSYKQYMK